MAEQSAFPILDWRPGLASSARFAASARTRLAGCPPVVHALVEQSQPYHLGNKYRSHALWRLHELDRFDKHRTLTLAAAALARQFLGARGDVEPNVTFFTTGGLVNDGDALVAYSHAEAGVTGFFTLDVAFDHQAPAAATESVTETLSDLMRYVTWLAGSLAVHL